VEGNCVCFELGGCCRQCFAVKAAGNQTEEFGEESSMPTSCSIHLGASCDYFFRDREILEVEINWTFPEE